MKIKIPRKVKKPKKSDDAGSVDVPVVVVTGSRRMTDREPIVYALTHLKNSVFKDGFRIVHGGQRGADKLAHAVAKELGIPSKAYLAKWNEHGPAAGPIRNGEMAELPGVRYGCAFPCPASKGTWDMVRQLADGPRCVIYIRPLDVGQYADE